MESSGYDMAVAVDGTFVLTCLTSVRINQGCNKEGVFISPNKELVAGCDDGKSPISGVSFSTKQTVKQVPFPLLPARLYMQSICSSQIAYCDNLPQRVIGFRSTRKTHAFWPLLLWAEQNPKCPATAGDSQDWPV